MTAFDMETFDELTAADVMRDDMVAIPEAMTVRGAARLLADAGALTAPVVDLRGRCVGLLRASDAIHWFAEGVGSEPGPTGFWSEWQLATTDEVDVRRLMTADPPAVFTDSPLREAARQLLARKSMVVVVDRRHRPVGVISPAEVLAAAAADGRARGKGGQVAARAGRGMTLVA